MTGEGLVCLVSYKNLLCLTLNPTVRRYTEEEWNAMKSEYGSLSDQHEAIKLFLRRFDDPYTTFFEPTTMEQKSDTFRGEKVTLGLSLVRRWNIGNMGRWQGGLDTVRGVFSNDKLLTLTRYALATALSAPMVSKGISSRLSKQRNLFISEQSIRIASLSVGGIMGLIDVCRLFVSVCGEVLVKELTGSAVESGLEIGDRVVSLYNGGSIKPKRYQNLRAMNKVIQDGPIDQYVFIKAIRKNGTDTNREMHLKCLRDYRWHSIVILFHSFIILANLMSWLFLTPKPQLIQILILLISLILTQT